MTVAAAAAVHTSAGAALIVRLYATRTTAASSMQEYYLVRIIRRQTHLKEKIDSQSIEKYETKTKLERKRNTR